MKRLYVVGLGPGAPELMTQQAAAALTECEVLCGYSVYIDLIKERYPGRRLITTPMGQEARRCRMALEEADAGRTTAMVCSGDAGVYGMAGLICELAPERPGVHIEIVPGITAALSGAALLGAPITHDFSVISLSDLLTPWEAIESRLVHAAAADFVICLYNPGSHGRRDHLRRVCAAIEQSRAGDTVCGYVRNIGRPGQAAEITTLAELKDMQADMFTTVFIGSSSTRSIGGKMVTPRGFDTAAGGLSGSLQ